eukprot:910503-Prymnesium_polylepis.1
MTRGQVTSDFFFSRAAWAAKNPNAIATRAGKLLSFAWRLSARGSASIVRRARCPSYRPHRRASDLPRST